jgi:iron complex outermembrane receptor protein
MTIWSFTRRATTVSCAVIAGGLGIKANAQGQKPKIKAQQVIESTLASHPEVTQLELSATPPGESGCRTVAATETKNIGEKCDNDELTALRTKKPFVAKEVEKGKQVYDITAPLRDSTGAVIGTIGIDIKPEPGQTRAAVLKIVSGVVHDLERQLKSRQELFEASK